MGIDLISWVSFFKKSVQELLAFRSKKKAESDSVATRFVQLFEAHGVHRNQIPRVIGHGLTVADVQSYETLLPKLSEELLNAACMLFAVRREWLDGADQQVYPTHDFYKRPEYFVEFIESLKKSGNGERVDGILLIPEEKSRNSRALIILQQAISFVGNKPIYRFHICDNWNFPYWKARGYLVACIASAWKRDVCILGRICPSSEIHRYECGMTLLNWRDDGIFTIKWLHTDPPYKMAREPSAYMEYIDEGQFGLVSALDLWLELDKQGLMETCFPHGGIRERFLEAKQKLEAGL